MWNLSKTLADACSSLGVRFLRMDEDESLILRQKLVHRYSSTNEYKYPLWDHLVRPATYSNPSGWKLLGDYLGHQRTLLFFEWTDCEDVFVFEDGADVVPVLAETHGFVLYLSNERLDYLLCFNDHDSILACGDAAHWVNNLPR